MNTGRRIMELIENDPFGQNSKEIGLESSLLFYRFYKKLGYKLKNDEMNLVFCVRCNTLYCSRKKKRLRN